MSTLAGKTTAQHVQRKLARAHHRGVISGGAYAFGTDIAEKLAFYAHPGVVAGHLGAGHCIAQEVLRLCMTLDAEWQVNRNVQED